MKTNQTAEKMGETKKLKFGGIEYTVTPIEVIRRQPESPVDYDLEDGSTIRVVNPVTLVYRLEGMTDPEGNPGYLVKTGTSVTVVRSNREKTVN